jgi:hypothetical protein
MSYKFPDEADDFDKKADVELDVTAEGDVIEADIIVEDDTPESDRKAQPLNRNVEDPTDDEIEGYTKGVQSRIKELTHARHDERRAKEAAQREKDEAIRLAQISIEEKKIQKANNSVSGKNIKIIYNIDLNIKNIIVSKYHQHSIFYVGHYLVKNGNIIEYIYLSQENKDPNYIHKGAVKRYKILDEYFPELNIFSKIFKKINYTGFACSDFIIENNNVLIFEINPRMGGSMRKDKNILNIFWNSLVNNF